MPMKRTLSTALLALVLASGVVLAASSYNLSRHTIGGGGESSGGNYILHGIIGQPDAGILNGGAYNLVGGFWHAAGAGENPGGHRLYLPAVMRN